MKNNAKILPGFQPFLVPYVPEGFNLAEAIKRSEIENSPEAISSRVRDEDPLIFDLMAKHSQIRNIANLPGGISSFSAHLYCIIAHFARRLGTTSYEEGFTYSGLPKVDDKLHKEFLSRLERLDVNEGLFFSFEGLDLMRRKNSPVTYEIELISSAVISEFGLTPLELEGVVLTSNLLYKAGSNLAERVFDTGGTFERYLTFGSPSQLRH